MRIGVLVVGSAMDFIEEKKENWSERPGCGGNEKMPSE